MKPNINGNITPDVTFNWTKNENFLVCGYDTVRWAQKQHELEHGYLKSSCTAVRFTFSITGDKNIVF